jgi:hypothetical protein
MEYQHKLILVSAVLVAAALYVVFTMPQPPPQGPASNSSEAEALLIQAAGFGSGLASYTYAYSDISDGYNTSYRLMADGGDRYVEVSTPLSTKRIFILENDTVFCIRYPVNESCVSVRNMSDMQNYIAFVESKFYNDTNILGAVASMKLLRDHGYLHAEPDMADGSVGGAACRLVTYKIDYSNISAQDAYLLGIGPNSPKEYNLTRCIGAESGFPFETTLKYAEGNISHAKTSTVSLFEKGAPQIPEVPEPGGYAIRDFRNDREQQVRLTGCFIGKQGAEREKCIADVALSLSRKDICELDGARRDQCLVSIVPLTKDETICGAIASESYKDDCFIELAGANKNASYCANVKNGSKAAFCQEVSAPRPPQNGTEGGLPETVEPPPQNESAGNASSDGVNPLGLLNFVEQHDAKPGGNATGNESAQGDTTE